jgi:hypothetical protein
MWCAVMKVFWMAVCVVLGGGCVGSCMGGVVVWVCGYVGGVGTMLYGAAGADGGGDGGSDGWW